MIFDDKLGAFKPVSLCPVEDVTVFEGAQRRGSVMTTPECCRRPPLITAVSPNMAPKDPLLSTLKGNHSLTHAESKRGLIGS